MSVLMKDVPTEVLMELSGKSFDWFLSFLSAETVFDVSAINVLMSLGHEAIVNELVRRQREAEEQSGAPVVVPCVEDMLADPEVDRVVASLFGGVLDVSMEGSSSDEELEALEQRLDDMAVTTKGDEQPDERPQGATPNKCTVKWFDLTNLDDHVLRRNIDYFEKDNGHFVYCFASAGETVGEMKKHGWRLFRCRDEDAPQQAAEPIELVFDDPDNTPF